MLPSNLGLISSPISNPPLRLAKYCIMQMPALHIADLGSIPGPTNGPPSTQ